MPQARRRQQRRRRSENETKYVLCCNAIKTSLTVRRLGNVGEQQHIMTASIPAEKKQRKTSYEKLEPRRLTKILNKVSPQHHFVLFRAALFPSSRFLSRSIGPLVLHLFALTFAFSIRSTFTTFELSSKVMRRPIQFSPRKN